MYSRSFTSAGRKFTDPVAFDSIALDHGQDPAHRDNYTDYQWEGFAAMMAVNLVGLVTVATRRDIVWTVGATWVDVAIWMSDYKPAPVFVRAFSVVPFLSFLLMRRGRSRRSYSPSSTPSRCSHRRSG
jgi:hypothetical protein